MNSPLIHLEHLHKSFRVHKKQPGFRASLRALFKRTWVEKVALRDFSLSISAGECVGLVGANGAGKTTLVKILAGILFPDSGTVSVLGCRPSDRLNEFKHQIALIMGQKAQLWWDLPAADCFLLLKEIYQIPVAEFESRLDELTKTLEVETLLNIPVRRLSLGERMKMELIAALLHQPRVIFLDEPTIGLDISAQKSLRRFLRSYRQRYQPAIILTSHYMEDIEELCERLVIVREGQKVFDGPTASILSGAALNKIIQFELERPLEPREISGLAQQLEIEILSADETILRISAPRKQLRQAIAHIMQVLPVHDVKTEETEIADVIEKMMKKESSARQ